MTYMIKATHCLGKKILSATSLKCFEYLKMISLNPNEKKERIILTWLISIICFLRICVQMGLFEVHAVAMKATGLKSAEMDGQPKMFNGRMVFWDVVSDREWLQDNWKIFYRKTRCTQIGLGSCIGKGQRMKVKFQNPWFWQSGFCMFLEDA